jgi:hypothetical protein
MWTNRAQSLAFTTCFRLKSLAHEALLQRIVINNAGFVLILNPQRLCHIKFRRLKFCLMVIYQMLSANLGRIQSILNSLILLIMLVVLVKIDINK